MGKVQSEFRIGTPFALHLDAPAVLIDDTVTNTEPQSHTFTDIFGGKKRIENFLNIFNSDAFAVIPHYDKALCVFLDPANPDGRSSFRAMLFFQRLQGVLQQIHQNLDNLVSIGPDRLGFGDFLFNAYLVFPLVAQQTQSGVYYFDDGDLLELG